MGREREIEERGNVTEITENTQRKKSAQRNAHTEGSQRKAEGKFKRAQTLREMLETKREEEGSGEEWGHGREDVGSPENKIPEEKV